MAVGDRRRFRPWTKKRGGRTLATATGSLVTESIYYTTILMVGVFGLSLVLALRLAPSHVPNLPPMPGAPPMPPLGSPVAAWTFGTLFFAAIMVGGGRLAHRLIWQSASVEFRRSLADRASRATRGSTVRRPDDFRSMPTVPDVESFNDSPGERLRYRLAPDRLAARRGSVSGRAGGQIALSLVWNVVWFVLAGIAVSGLIRGVIRPFLIFLLVPAAWVGWRLFRSMLSAVRTVVAVGPTVVEISDHPLHPGDRFRVDVSQWGRMKLRRLTVRLVCEEESFYRQGTDVRADRHRVVEIEIGQKKNVSVDRHRVAGQQYDVQMPADAMHSVAGSHNAIRWQIEVEGSSRPWPSFCRTFPVVVHPPAAAAPSHPR